MEILVNLNIGDVVEVLESGNPEQDLMYRGWKAIVTDINDDSGEVYVSSDSYRIMREYNRHVRRSSLIAASLPPAPSPMRIIHTVDTEGTVIAIETEPAHAVDVRRSCMRMIFALLVRVDDLTLAMIEGRDTAGEMRSLRDAGADLRAYLPALAGGRSRPIERTILREAI